MVVEKLIHSVDDTIMIGKMILREIDLDFSNLIETKAGLSLISSIYIPKHSLYTTFEKDTLFTKSKKDAGTRL